MIIDTLVGWITGALEWLMGLFPTSSPIDGVVDKLGDLMGNLGGLNYFLPIAPVFAIVAGVLVMFPVLFGVNFALWCVMALRGGSSRA